MFNNYYQHQPTFAGYDTLEVAPESVFIPIQEQPKTAPVVDESIQISPVSTFYSDQKNISFSIPPGWNTTKMSEAFELPPGADNPWVVLQHPLETCLIAGGKVSYRLVPDDENEPGSALYAQINYGGWYVPITSEELGLHQFVGHHRLPIPREVSMTQDFYVWDNPGGTVSKKCEDDFEYVIRSRANHVRQVPLNEITSGTIRTKQFEITTENFVAIRDDHGDTFKLMDLPPVTYYHGRFTYRENLLYAITSTAVRVNSTSTRSNDAVISVDLFNASSSKVFDSQQFGGLYIASYLIAGDSLYVLAGDNSFKYCMDGWKSCYGDLYHLSLETGESQLFKAGVRAKRIYGHSEDQKFLYLSDGNGDAGCTSQFISQIDIATKQEEVLFDVGWCADDNLPSPEQIEFQKFSDEIKLRLTGGLRYENGSFARIPAASDNPYTSDSDTVFYFAD